ncbi:MAG: 2-dehydropantoate 2-reductase [Verrucomicrobiaceae bacterium]|nr:2-dehydropantoate 2-reductase [Verrucomicrobiaceae bacterium]
MTAEQPTWHILGAGAIGCLFASYLQRAQHRVELIVRDSVRLSQLQENSGVLLECAETTASTPISGVLPTKITTAITHCLICTKAPQTIAALSALKKYLAPKPILILVQNGMGIRERILQLIPDAIVLNAITTEGAYRRAAFHIVHASTGNTLIGAMELAEQPYAQDAAAALQCELPIAAQENIAQQLWLKLSINSVINPLTALRQCRNGELLKLANIDEVIALLSHEFNALAQAEGYIFSTEFLIGRIKQVMRDTAANYSSMQQDIRAKRHTEIDYINGFIVQRALRHNIACPEHAKLFDAIKQKEHTFM